MLGSDGSGSAWDISSSRVLSASGKEGSGSAWDISSSRVLSASDRDGSGSAWDVSSTGVQLIICAVAMIVDILVGL